MHTAGSATLAGPRYAQRAAGITGSAIDASMGLLAAQERDVIRLAMGSPAPEAVPTEVFQGLLAGLATPQSFDYAPSEGDPALRAALRAWLESRGEPVDPASLLITSGGMQGLDLACKLFVDPGDLVAVESPTYTNGTATISGYRGEMVEVPGDGDGMDVAELERIVAASGRPPKLIYTIPTFQNPSGTTLSLPRRRRLVELAADWDAVLLEDDPYRMLRFAGEDLPSLRELAAGRARVVAVHTFSKLLAPGLRVGWLVADPPVIDLMVKARHAMDTCTNTLQQRLVEAFLTEGHLDAHVTRLRASYHKRKTGMQDSLARHLDGIDASWTDPQGGFFLWLTLRESVDSSALFSIALAEGVAFVPGPAFSIGGRFRNALRLAFSAEPTDRADEGLRRLRRAIDRSETPA